MIVIERSTTIDRPVEEVFAFVSDPANDPRWQSDILEVSKPPGPLAAGSRFEWIVKFMGKRKTPVEVLELLPNERFQIRVLSGPPFGLLPTVTYSLQPSNGRTRFTRRIEVQPSGMGRVMGPMIAKMIGRYSTSYLKTLKGLLERGGG